MEKSTKFYVKNLMWKRMLAFPTQEQKSMKMFSSSDVTLTPESKKKPQRILFMKCNDYVGIFSNMWLDTNAQCSSCIKFESIQTLKNCNVISLLMTKKAQKTGKKVNSVYEFAIFVSLKWIYCNIYPVIYLFRQCNVRLKDCSKCIMKLRNFRKGVVLICRKH